MLNSTVWIIIGFCGQIMFFMRFFMQWLHSEKHKKSLIPTSFWFFSVAGGIVLLIYAIHKQDQVFIVGQAGGLFIYSRNIYFIYREHKKNESAAP